jgi:hypothetical protein
MISTQPYIAQAVILIAAAVLLCGLLAWMIVLQIRLRRLTRQYTALLRGADETDLTSLLHKHVDEVRQALKTISALEQRTTRLEQAQPRAIQWVGSLRFNPFRHTGGAQSFALALVDDQGNGFVLSSLHARENTRVYAKPLKDWTSDHLLTDEETQAIERAQRQQALAQTRSKDTASTGLS